MPFYHGHLNPAALQPHELRPGHHQLHLSRRGTLRPLMLQARPGADTDPVSIPSLPLWCHPELKLGPQTLQACDSSMSNEGVTPYHTGLARG